LGRFLSRSFGKLDSRLDGKLLGIFAVQKLREKIVAHLEWPKILFLMQYKPT